MKRLTKRICGVIELTHGVQEAISKLAHYEDLEEAGRLMILSKGFNKEYLLCVLASDECIVHFGGKAIENCNGTNCKECWEAALKGE